MKIGIIGSGNMGRALGVRFAQLGHEIMFGARRPEQAKAATTLAGAGTLAGDNDAAARHGEVLLWTMRDHDPAHVLRDPGLLDGKVVIDLNNRDYADEARTGAWFDRAIAEKLQEAAPGARVVKAFNTIAMESFDVEPEALRRAGAQTFIAGGDGDAKRVAAGLTEELGFKAVDLGAGPAAMRAAEALGDAIRLLMIDQALGGRAHLRVDYLPAPALEAVGARQPSAYN
jgi:hypothetical protein